MGGVSAIFSRIAISSYIRVQMGRELVRLIDLIHLNMFSIHIVHWNSSGYFLWTRFGRSVSKNTLKMTFLAFYTGFMHKTLIKGQNRPFLAYFLGRIAQKLSIKNILRTSTVQYGSKTCSDGSDLSIAPTPDPFRHV